MTAPSSPANLVQGRRNARQKTLQALYQWELNPQSSVEIINQFLASQDMRKVDIEYFSELLKQVINNVDHLDSLFAPFLDIPIAQLDPVERAVLRLAVGELNKFTEIPPKVVINEAIDLTKKFGAAEAYKFINGVLDKYLNSMQSTAVE